MASSEQLDIPTYFAPNAFAMARVMGGTIEYSPELLARFSDTAQELIGKGLPPLSTAAFVFRHVQYGPEQPKIDPPFNNIGPGERIYTPADQLALPIDKDPKNVQKAEIQQNHSPFEVRVKNFGESIIGEVVETLIYPPPEDHVMRPGGGTAHFLRAWGAQIGEAFGITGAPEVKKEQLRREAIRYFAGAIVLRPREK